MWQFHLFWLLAGLSDLPRHLTKRGSSATTVLITYLYGSAILWESCCCLLVHTKPQSRSHQTVFKTLPKILWEPITPKPGTRPVRECRDAEAQAGRFPPQITTSSCPFRKDYRMRKP
jgi:hypothetical protein